MGTDKAMLCVEGQPMALRVANALGLAGASTVTAVGGSRGDLEDIGMQVVPDRWPGDGPLGAVVHALAVVGSEPAVAVLSCDLLAPDAGLVRSLVDRLHAGDADVVVPMVDQRAQWLHAVWRRRVGSVLGDVFAAGERSVHGAVQGLRVDYDATVPGSAVRDVDVPGDLPSA